MECVLDTQVLSGLVVTRDLTRGSEVFQNIPGFVRKLYVKKGMMDETADICGDVVEIVK